jgi:hypothetical protein
MLILLISFLLDFMRVDTFDLDSALTLRCCNLEYFILYEQFSFLISKLVDVLIQ